MQTRPLPLLVHSLLHHLLRVQAYLSATPQAPTIPHNTSVPMLGRREQEQSTHKNNKYDSLQRSQPINSAFNLYTNTNELYERKMSIEELKNYVEAQIKTIAAQRAELKELELALSNDSERELVQLKKQHNNLQTVLNSLRNANWPKEWNVSNQKLKV
uniref:Uncharacterized protein n=1 Tax=Ditylenchus dipsaci TaxID=166011 RepID=A0A915EJF6_9BILA